MNDTPTPRTDAKAMGFRRQTVGAVESAIEWAEQLERDLAAALAWTDEDQEISEEREIKAAHPVNADTHKQYAEAMRMVSAKRSKGALVELVCWLIVRAERAEAELARVKAERDSLQRAHDSIMDACDQYGSYKP